MRDTRSALATALALGLIVLVVRPHVGTRSEAAPQTSRDVAESAIVDDLPPHRTAIPSTTTSTTVVAPAPPVSAPPPAAKPRTIKSAAPATTAPPAPITADAASEARALELVNGERARAGLPALQLNGGATSVARSWARWMAGHSLAHNSNLARDLERAGVTGWRTIGENVGDGHDADQVHRMFMTSGGHRANILSDQFSAVGVGAVRRGDHVWITLDFVGW